jgi:hypothetical protein
MIAGVDGGAGQSAAQALCISGQTGPTQYYGAVDVTFEFGFAGAVPDGGPATISVGHGSTTSPPPALIDASQYHGIRFWLWVSPDTVSGVASSLEVCLADKFDTLGAVSTGGCDPYSTGPTACGIACADVFLSTAYLSQGAGELHAGDGGLLTTLSSGWQLVEAPWSAFLLNPHYGGAIETAIDPTSLTFLAIGLQPDLPPDGGLAPIPFDLCAYDVTFY